MGILCLGSLLLLRGVLPFIRIVLNESTSTNSLFFNILFLRILLIHSTILYLYFCESFIFFVNHLFYFYKNIHLIFNQH